jgi:hypothetical protein
LKALFAFNITPFRLPSAGINPWQNTSADVLHKVTSAEVFFYAFNAVYAV